MRISRRAAAAAAVSVAAAGCLAVSAPQAAAAAAYGGECGRGYGVVNSAPIGTKGTVFLTYNPSSGYNCVVTKRTTTGSTPVYMFSHLQVPETGDWDEDSGTYYSYAGPVYAYGKGMCVDWAGGIANQSTWTYGSNCGSFAEHRVTRGW
ncbi:spore-associated protein A [Streptomyces sp. URMC 125]|uniref:spore-associated protein A n=1 Tax=Streptomyces sp. URMC 125 TaxID=3423419 RepID=UPI003F1BC5FA